MVIQKILRRYAQIAAACLLCVALGSAQALDLRKDLSEAQFKAAGLSKLDRAELDALQKLIDAKTMQSTVAEQIVAKPAVAKAKAAPKPKAAAKPRAPK